MSAIMQVAHDVHRGDMANAARWMGDSFARSASPIAITNTRFESDVVRITRLGKAPISHPSRYQSRQRLIGSQVGVRRM